MKKRELKKGKQAKFVAMTEIQPFTKKILTFSNRDYSGGTKTWYGFLVVFEAVYLYSSSFFS